MSAAPARKSSPLWEILFPHDDETGLATYTILDGAACEDLLPMLEEHQPENCCLYAGDLDDDVAEVAPYLIHLDAGHPFTAWLLEAIGHKPWGIFCKASATLRELRKHFRKFLIVKGPDGKSLYFRYYDPRVLSTFLPSCDHDQIIEIFGDLESIFTALPNLPIHEFQHTQGKLKISYIA